MEPWLLTLCEHRGTQLVPKRCSSSEGHDFHSRSALPKANAPDPPPFMIQLFSCWTCPSRFDGKCRYTSTPAGKFVFDTNSADGPCITPYHTIGIGGLNNGGELSLGACGQCTCALRAFGCFL